ncbi:ATP-binding cassette domain-containing protein [Congregibacter variabilis]|uniref:ATP-binding cassette domain-containing protein n=1 Tax=Congregibacter variabilis TaxID=3081200 RepID=A0ABZ0I6Z0_9GAMM|nr:ATP-binding cassette domain-containing protein [Congregibacter sp. IMCC43200]
MSPPLLDVHNAGLRFAASTLLSEISFSLGSGEVIGIAGSNGAGKSSLLRLACAEYSCSSGSVSLDGTDIGSIEPRTRAKRIAVLPQSMGLQFDFTVRQVSELGRSPHGDLGGAGSQVVDQVLDSCELTSLAHRLYPSLSGGEKQRTQFARVLAQLLPKACSSDLSGQILILDEPTSAMDVRHQERFLRLVAKLRDLGCAVLLVMHDINLLSRCSDRLLYLKHGRMLSLGPTAEQLNEQALSELYEYPLRIRSMSDGTPPFVYPASHAPNA